MSGIAIGLGAVAIAGTAYGAIESSTADKQAAQVDTAVGAFNQKVDIENAQQLDQDTLQNIDTERAADATYVSREAAGYAAAGVIATTGSALHAQITTVGRMTQQIQQQYRDSQIKQAQLYEQGQLAVAEGAAQASADNAAATLALIQGGTQIAGMALSDYEHFGTTSKPPGNSDTGGNGLF